VRAQSLAKHGRFPSDRKPRAEKSLSDCSSGFRRRNAKVELDVLREEQAGDLSPADGAEDSVLD
jgi:hypothetical protein